MPSADDRYEMVEKLYNNETPVKEMTNRRDNSISIACNTLERVKALEQVGRKNRYRRRRNLTPEEIEMIKKLYIEGKTVREIAKTLNRSRETIYRVLERLGLKPRRHGHRFRNPRAVTREEAELMKKLYLEGKTLYEIASMLNRAETTVYYTLKKLGVIEKRRKSRNRPLTPEEIEAIKKLYTAGKSINEIARALCRPESTIYLAVKRLGLIE